MKKQPEVAVDDEMLEEYDFTGGERGRYAKRNLEVRAPSRPVYGARADLFRIKGIAGEYAELLKASGVDTVAALARRNAANLAKVMEEKNSARKIVRQVPTERQVEGWIAEAKSLPRKVIYRS